VDGAVIYTVEVKNKTSEYIRNVRVQFTSYDAAGNIIDTDWTYVSGLSPGGPASGKGYATYFGREKEAGMRIMED